MINRRFIRRTGRFRRKPFRRTTFRRRIFSARRAMTRRRARPEIKWVDASSGSVNTIAFTKTTFSLTPGTIPQGTTRGTRIGNKIKFLRNSSQIDILNLMDSTASNQISRVRVLIVNPRVDNANFTSYVAGWSPSTQSFDHNIGTIYMDRNYTLSNLTGTLNNYATGNLTGLTFYKSIKFPRTVEFRDGIEDVQDAKDRLYLIVCNLNTVTTGTTITTTFRSKTSFIDL